MVGAEDRVNLFAKRERIQEEFHFARPIEARSRQGLSLREREEVERRDPTRLDLREIGAEHVMISSSGTPDLRTRSQTVR